VTWLLLDGCSMGVPIGEIGSPLKLVVNGDEEELLLCRHGASKAEERMMVPL
jgi:hypothetical protein